MKLYRNIIILVVMFLVLGGVLLALKLTLKDEETDFDDDSIITLYNFESTKLTEYTIESEEGTFVFRKKSSNGVTNKRRIL